MFEVAKKLVIKKKILKVEADMKKINNWVVKNRQTTIEKSQITKRKTALFVIDWNVIKKYQSNKKAGKDKKLEDEPKLEKDLNS